MYGNNLEKLLKVDIGCDEEFMDKGKEKEGDDQGFGKGEEKERNAIRINPHI